MPVKKPNSNSAKPKTRKKRQSINFISKPNKKRAVKSDKDQVKTDFVEKVERRRQEQNKERYFSKSSEEEESSEANQDTQPKMRGTRKQQQSINSHRNSSKKETVALDEDQVDNATRQERNEEQNPCESNEEVEESSKVNKSNQDTHRKRLPTRKRRQFINSLIPSKKKAGASSEDQVAAKIKKKTQKNGQDKQNKTSENDENEEIESNNDETSLTNKTSPNNQQNMFLNRFQRTAAQRQVPGTSQSNASSKRSSISSGSTFTTLTPELPDEGETHLETEAAVQIQTDKNFFQQQIQLLRTAFTLQDCPGLSGNQRRKNCLPHNVIQDALRKLNHKMDDEIQKHLNRQCQRKVLSDILEMEGTKNEEEQGETCLTETMCVSEILEKCSDGLYENGDTDRNLLRRFLNAVSELRTLHDEIREVKQKISAFKSNNQMILKVELLAKGATQRSLRNEVKRTNKLVNHITQVLRHKANSV